MRKAQQNFLNYLSAIERTLQKNQSAALKLGIDLQPVSQLAESIRSKELLVPVVGAFSAGKSSLLNAILGNELLPVAITPETAIPTELRHDVRERLQVFFTDEHTEEFRVEDLPQLQSRAAEIDCVRLYLNNDALAALAPLVLVDMPGFNSPLDSHNKAIARYIGEGAHYLFVVSVEEGTLHSSTLNRIDEISHLGRSFSICVNKADLRTPADVEAICTHIGQRLEDDGLEANVCAVSQRNAASVQAMLSSIDPEVLFITLFQPALEQQQRALDGVLKAATDGLQRDQADNDRHLEEMTQALLALQQEQKQKTAALLGADLVSHTDDILKNVRHRLELAVDSMAQVVLRGGHDELSRIVSDEVRSGLIEGARLATDHMSAQMVDDFSQRVASSLHPEVHVSKDWTDGLLQQLQSELLPALLSSMGSISGKGGDVRSRVLGMASVVGTLVPHPILKVALTLLPLVLGGVFGKVSEGQKLEKIKEALRNQVLPDIDRRLRPEVQLFLQSAQQQALKLVADAFEEQIKQQKEALSQASIERKAGGKDALLGALQETRSELKALAEDYL
ncbi:dynamin family protein [Acidovorax sp. CCYZU-2555]|uniref:dynamin family protein n=1 Tax=Acidovorax sp. CCYZU-2555 TaxID=2835042 RepID=UPI001BCF7027|nr:dynamin family protein [Acidovorax sp. CCYZU-2555]MBS7780103.1 dynamin family protein [Acidovorax sp. CCYZU-2555]